MPDGSAARGLLGRLSSGQRRAATNEGDVKASILAHLQVLLNSQMGQALTAPDLGVVDFAELRYLFPDAARVLEDSVKAVIAEYEPRLRNVRVRYVGGDDPMRVRLDITAVIAGGGRGRRRARFATHVVPGGRMQVSSS